MRKIQRFVCVFFTAFFFIIFDCLFTNTSIIPPGCGSKLRGTWLESRPSRLFVIEVVHVQCSRLLKGMYCVVLSMVLYIIKNPWSHSKRVGQCHDFWFPSVAILPWLYIKRSKTIFTHHIFKLLVSTLHSLNEFAKTLGKNWHIFSYVRCLVLMWCWMSCVSIISDVEHDMSRHNIQTQDTQSLWTWQHYTIYPLIPSNMPGISWEFSSAAVEISSTSDTKCVSKLICALWIMRKKWQWRYDSRDALRISLRNYVNLNRNAMSEFPHRTFSECIKKNYPQ